MIQLFILATRSWFSTMGALMGCPLFKSALRGPSACFVRLATEVSSSTQALQSQYQKRSRFFFKGRNLQCVFLHLKESLSLSKVQNTLQLPDSSLVVWVQGAGGTFPSPWHTACMAPPALAAVIWGGLPRLEGQKLARSPVSETSCTKANPQTRTSQALPCWNRLVLFPLIAKAWSGGPHGKATELSAKWHQTGFGWAVLQDTARVMFYHGNQESDVGGEQWIEEQCPQVSNKRHNKYKEAHQLVSAIKMIS